jgi:hypothetical protein
MQFTLIINRWYYKCGVVSCWLAIGDTQMLRANGCFNLLNHEILFLQG